jgi:hypothetical protein
VVIVVTVVSGLVTVVEGVDDCGFLQCFLLNKTWIGWYLPHLHKLDLVVAKFQPARILKADESIIHT